MDASFNAAEQFLPQYSQTLQPSSQAQSYRASESQSFIPEPLPIDYRLLLLTLADNYVDEAHALSADIVYNRPGASSEEYCKLMSTGLACLHVALKKLPGTQPRQDAVLHLYYASLLFEETDNHYDTEMVLGKLIPFCERNRLNDIKYGAKHLQSRFLFKTKPKAGLRYLDDAIDEATTWGHMPWFYAFRFLRVSFSLALGTPQDILAAMQHIKAITDCAKSNGDITILAIAAILEAYLHVSVHEVHSITEAQGAIATARGALMSSSTPVAPHMETLLSALELACSVDPNNFTQSKENMDRLQLLLDQWQQQNQTVEDASGTFLVPIGNYDGNLTRDTGGVFAKDLYGRDCLVFSSHSKLDTYVLGFVLSIAAIFPHKRSTLEYLSEGFKIISDENAYAHTSKSDSLPQAMQRVTRRQVLRSHLLLYLILIRLDKSEWHDARAALTDLHGTVDRLGSQTPLYLRCFAQYLRGVVEQATGEFKSALQSYSSPLLFVPTPHDRSASHIQTMLAILAALNTLHILNGEGSSSTRAQGILATLAPHFPGGNVSNGASTVASSNPQLVSAYKFAATLFGDLQISKKSSLQASLHAAKTAGNMQLLTFCTTYLYDFMCRGILGESNVNNAKGALMSARKLESKTWVCVAAGQLADAFALEGNMQRAEQGRQEANEFLSFLPGTLGVVSENGPAPQRNAKDDVTT